MNHHPVYAFGYTGRQLSTIVEAVTRDDGVLVDIRFSPRSRAPMWNRRNLEAALGDRYVWAGETLGNRLYRTDSIAIVDLVLGLDLAEHEAARHPVFLMCVCPRPAGCHRTIITEAMRERGFTVVEGLP